MMLGNLPPPSPFLSWHFRGVQVSIYIRRWSLFKFKTAREEQFKEFKHWRIPLLIKNVFFFIVFQDSEKKGFINKIYAIQEVCISVQNILDEVASFGERIKKWVMLTCEPWPSVGQSIHLFLGGWNATLFLAGDTPSGWSIAQFHHYLLCFCQSLVLWKFCQFPSWNLEHIGWKAVILVALKK